MYQQDNAPPPYPPGPGRSGGGGLGKQMLLLALVCLGGFLLYRSFFAGNGSITDIFKDPKEVRVTYVPSDFQPNLNEEATLKILADPAANRAAFDELVYNFNVSLLYHVANRMSLPDSLKRRLEPEYKVHHDYLRNLYFNDFVALKDSTAVMYESWYNDNANQAVQVFNEVAGKYTCFFVTQVLATLLKTNGGKLMAKGKNVETPCGLAINEGLKPMAERLQKKAQVMDFSASRGFLKEKVRRGIAELATYELRSRMAIDKTLQYKVFGFTISDTNIEIEAISVVKAGFKLDRFFDVTFSPKKNVVFVTLPQPTIVSHEVFPRMNKLDVGVLAGITEAEMNKNLNELRRQFRDDALNNEKVLDKAKARADSVMQLMLGPMVKGMGRNLKLEVRFQDVAEQPDDSELRRRGETPAEQPKTKPKSGFIPQ